MSPLPAMISLIAVGVGVALFFFGLQAGMKTLATAGFLCATLGGSELLSVLLKIWRGK